MPTSLSRSELPALSRRSSAKHSSPEQRSSPEPRSRGEQRPSTTRRSARAHSSSASRLSARSGRRPRRRPDRDRRSVRRNRRRGAPRSLVVRRVLAVLLAGCAALLVLRPSGAAPSATTEDIVEADQPAGIPLVLPLADPASASVLTPGEHVDLYVAHGDEPPVLSLSGVQLVDVQTSESVINGTTGHGGSGAYIVIRITAGDLGSVESLLAASSIIATVSAVGSD